MTSSRASFQGRFGALPGGDDGPTLELRPFIQTPFLRLENGDLVLLAPPWLLSWFGEGFH